MKESKGEEESSPVALRSTQSCKMNRQSLTTLLLILACSSSQAFQQGPSIGGKGASLQQLLGSSNSHTRGNAVGGGGIHHQQSRRLFSRGSDPLQVEDDKWKLQAQPRGSGGNQDSLNPDQRRQTMDMRGRIQRLMDRSNSLTEQIAASPNSLSFVWMEDQLRSLTAHLQMRKNSLHLDPVDAKEAADNIAWIEQELVSAAQQLDEFKSIVVSSLNPKVRDNDEELRKEMEEISRMSAQLEAFLKETCAVETKVFSDESSKRAMMDAYERAQTSISRLDSIRQELAAVEDALDEMEGSTLVAEEEDTFTLRTKRRDPAAPHPPETPPTQDMVVESMSRDGMAGGESANSGGAVKDESEQPKKKGGFFAATWQELNTWPSMEPGSPPTSPKQKKTTQKAKIISTPTHKKTSEVPKMSVETAPVPPKRAANEKVGQKTKVASKNMKKEATLIAKSNSEKLSTREAKTQARVSSPDAAANIPAPKKTHVPQAPVEKARATTTVPKVVSKKKQKSQVEVKMTTAKPTGGKPPPVTAASVEPQRKPKKVSRPKPLKENVPRTKATAKSNEDGGGWDWGKLLKTLTNLGNAEFKANPTKEKASVASKKSLPLTYKTKPYYDAERSLDDKQKLIRATDYLMSNPLGPPPRFSPPAVIQSSMEDKKKSLPRNWGQMLSYEPVKPRPKQWARVQEWVDTSYDGAVERLPKQWASMVQYTQKGDDLPDANAAQEEAAMVPAAVKVSRPKRWAQFLSYIHEQKQQHPNEASNLPHRWALMKEYVKEYVHVPSTSNIPQRWAEMKQWTAVTKTAAEDPTLLQVVGENELPSVYEAIMSWASRQQVAPSANQVLYLLRNQKISAAAKSGQSRWGDLENQRASVLTEALLDAGVVDLPEEIGQPMPATVALEGEGAGKGGIAVYYEERTRRVAKAASEGKSRWGFLENRRALESSGQSLFIEASVPIPRMSTFSIDELAKEWKVANSKKDEEAPSPDVVVAKTEGKAGRFPGKGNEMAQPTVPAFDEDFGKLSLLHPEPSAQLNDAGAELSSKSASPSFDDGFGKLSILESDEKSTSSNMDPDQSAVAVEQAYAGGSLEGFIERRRNQISGGAPPPPSRSGPVDPSTPLDQLPFWEWPASKRRGRGGTMGQPFENLGVMPDQQTQSQSLPTQQTFEPSMQEMLRPQMPVVEETFEPSSEETPLSHIRASGGAMDLYHTQIPEVSNPGKPKSGTVESTISMFGESQGFESENHYRQHMTSQNNQGFSGDQHFSAMAGAGRSRWAEMENGGVQQMASRGPQNWPAESFGGAQEFQRRDFTKSPSELFQERAQKVSVMADAGRSRWGAMENDKAHQMADMLDLNDIPNESVVMSATGSQVASMGHLADEWSSVEQGGGNGVDESSSASFGARDFSKSPSELFQERALKVSSMAGAGRSRWGAMENQKAQQMADALGEMNSPAGPIPLSEPHLSGMEQLANEWTIVNDEIANVDTVEGSMQIPSPVEQVGLPASDTQAVGMDSSVHEWSVSNDNGPARTVEAAEPLLSSPTSSNELYDGRSRKVAAMAEAGKSRWGSMENNKVSGKSPTQEELLEARNPEATKSSLLGNIFDLFQGRNEKVAAMADAGKSRWGQMENQKAQQRVTSFETGQSIVSQEALTTNGLNDLSAEKELTSTHDSVASSRPDEMYKGRSAKVAAMAEAGKSRWGAMENQKAQQVESGVPPANTETAIVNEPEPTGAMEKLASEWTAMNQEEATAEFQSHGPKWEPLDFGVVKEEVKSDHYQGAGQDEASVSVSETEKRDTSQWKPLDFGVVEGSPHATVETFVSNSTGMEANWADTSQSQSSNGQWRPLEFGVEQDPLDSDLPSTDQLAVEESTKSSWKPLYTEPSVEETASYRRAKAQAALRDQIAAELRATNEKAEKFAQSLSDRLKAVRQGPVNTNDAVKEEDSVELEESALSTNPLSGVFSLYEARTRKVAAVSDSKKSRWGDMESQKAQRIVSYLGPQGTEKATASSIDHAQEGSEVDEGDFQVSAASEESVVHESPVGPVAAYKDRTNKVAAMAEVGKSRWGAMENKKAQSLVDPGSSPAEVPSSMYDGRTAKVAVMAEAGKSRWGPMENQRARELKTPIVVEEKDASGLYKDRAAKVAAMSDAGKSRWGEKENQKAQQMTNSMRKDGVIEELIVDPVSPPSMTDLAAEWALINQEKALKSTSPMPIPTERLNPRADDVSEISLDSSLEGARSTDPEDLFEMRAAKVAAMAEAGKSRWGTMENKKAQEMTDPLDAAEVGYQHLAEAENSSSMDHLASEWSTMNQEQEVSSTCFEAMSGETGLLDEVNAIDDSEVITASEPLDLEDLYLGRNAKVAAMADAGKSRWGTMENQKAQQKANPLMSDHEDPEPEASSLMDQLAAEWARTNKEQIPSSATPTESHAAFATGIDKITKPTILGSIVDLFQGRNEKVAAMASAGKSRWGTMENTRAKNTVDSVSFSDQPLSYSDEKGVIDSVDQNTIELDDDSMSTEQSDSTVVGADVTVSSNPLEPLFRPKVKRSWTLSMNDWAKAWSDMNNHLPSPSMEQLANGWTSMKGGILKSTGREEAAVLRGSTEASSSITEHDIVSSRPDSPPSFSMEQLAKEWTAMNGDRSKVDGMGQGRPNFEGVPVRERSPRVETPAKVTTHDAKSMKELAREWGALNKVNEESGDQISAPFLQQDITPSVPDVDEIVEQMKKDLPNGYKTVMEWAATEIDPPTIANVIFQLRNVNVANFATAGKSRWGRAENMRSSAMVKAMIEAVSGLSNSVETDLLTEPTTDDTLFDHETEPDAPSGEVPNTAGAASSSSPYTEYMDELTASWAEDWAIMNEGGVVGNVEPAKGHFGMRGENARAKAQSDSALSRLDELARDTAMSVFDKIAGEGSMNSEKIPSSSSSDSSNPMDWGNIMKEWSRMNSDHD